MEELVVDKSPSNPGLLGNLREKISSSVEKSKRRLDIELSRRKQEEEIRKEARETMQAQREDEQEATELTEEERNKIFEEELQNANKPKGNPLTAITSFIGGGSAPVKRPTIVANSGTPIIANYGNAPSLNPQNQGVPLSNNTNSLMPPVSSSPLLIGVGGMPMAGKTGGVPLFGGVGGGIPLIGKTRGGGPQFFVPKKGKRASGGLNLLSTKKAGGLKIRGKRGRLF